MKQMRLVSIQTFMFCWPVSNICFILYRLVQKLLNLNICYNYIHVILKVYIYGPVVA